MNDIFDKDEWFRPEFKDRTDELASRSDYEKLKGLKDKTMVSRFRDYADRVPEIVLNRWRSGSYPEKVYVVAELDHFMESIPGHDAPRTPLEKVKAEVARRKVTVEDYAARLAKKEAEVEKARRALAVQQRKLKQAEERVRIEEEL